MAMGAYQALVAARKENKVMVFGFDGSDDVMNAIADKKIMATVIQSPKQIAITSADLADQSVVIGGTSLSGGRGSIMGTVQGALIIGVLNSGLVLLNVSPFWQQIIKGLVIFLAVIMDRLNHPNED